MRRYLTDDELTRFMDAVRSRDHAHRMRDHALFALLANLGVRPSEALRLDRASIHAEETPAWIRIGRLKKRKSVEEFDEIELRPDLADIVAAYLSTLPDDVQRPFRTNRRALQRRFKAYARQAGLRAHVRLYDLRHTAATRMYLTTRDIKSVQTMLGHENPDTSSIYAHVPASLVESTANSMPVFV